MSSWAGIIVQCKLSINATQEKQKTGQCRQKNFPDTVYNTGFFVEGDNKGDHYTQVVFTDRWQLRKVDNGVIKGGWASNVVHLIEVCRAVLWRLSCRDLFQCPTSLKTSACMKQACIQLTVVYDNNNKNILGLYST